MFKVKLKFIYSIYNPKSFNKFCVKRLWATLKNYDVPKGNDSLYW